MSSSFKLVVILIFISNLRSICSEIYIEEHLTGFPTVDQSCEDDYDCFKFYICISGVCKCAPDYKLKRGQCEPFNCANDVECQTYDPNRVCAGNEHKHNSSSCVCRNNYEYNHDQRLCQIKDNQLIWLLVLAFLPLLLILMSCWYCYTTARSKNNYEDTTQTEPTTPQTPNIIITDLQSLQSYPNLNEFFMNSPKLQRFKFRDSFNNNNNKEITNNGTDFNGITTERWPSRGTHLTFLWFGSNSFVNKE